MAGKTITMSTFKQVIRLYKAEKAGKRLQGSYPFQRIQLRNITIRCHLPNGRCHLRTLHREQTFIMGINIQMSSPG
jgi:hypothetical protein